MNEEKFSSTQRMRELMGGVAEELVALHLALRCLNSDWIVRRAILEQGGDLILDHKKKDIQLKIEVKSRQRLATRQNPKSSVLFQMGIREYENCDIAVCVFWDDNSIYIVPKDQWIVSKSGKVADWTLKRNSKDGSVKPECLVYRDRWDLILDAEVWLHK